MSDYSGDSQRCEMIERENQRRDFERQGYIESLEKEVEELKRKLKTYEEGDR